MEYLWCITLLSAILHWFFVYIAIHIARVIVHHWGSRLICEIACKDVGIVHNVVIIIICVWVIKLINALASLFPILLQQAIPLSLARFLFCLNWLILSSSWLNAEGDCFLLDLTFLYNSSYFFFPLWDHPLPPPSSWTPLFWENVYSLVCEMLQKSIC